MLPCQYLTQRPSHGNTQAIPALLPPPPDVPRPGAVPHPSPWSRCGCPLPEERHHLALPPEIAKLHRLPLLDAQSHAPRILRSASLLHGRGIHKLCQCVSEKGKASVPAVTEPLLCAPEENVEDQGVFHPDLHSAVRKPVQPLNMLPMFELRWSSRWGWVCILEELGRGVGRIQSKCIACMYTILRGLIKYYIMKKYVIGRLKQRNKSDEVLATLQKSPPFFSCPKGRYPPTVWNHPLNLTHVQYVF